MVGWLDGPRSGHEARGHASGMVLSRVLWLHLGELWREAEVMIAFGTPDGTLMYKMPFDISKGGVNGVQ